MNRNRPCFALTCLGVIFFGLHLLIGPSEARAQRPLGIDVSHYQGTIDWAAVKNSGIVFAWAKATEGTGYLDPTFANNEAAAKTAGVKIGAYHFARPDLNLGTNGAIAEANYFWSNAKNYIKTGGFYMMPMLDIEQQPGTNYTRASLSQWVNAWCARIVSNAAASNVTVHPVVYTYVSYSSTWLNSTVTQWPLWMANYNGQDPQSGAPSGISPWPTWNFWQYSSTGTIPGISGNCDQDVFNGTSTTLLSTYVIGGATNPPTITSPPQNLAEPLGAPASFSVTATGLGPLRFQWRFNQTNIAGATATSYALSAIQVTNAGGFSVAVSNAGGTTVSAPGFLAVLTPLTNAPGCILAPPGMVNWWPADGNPNDIYGTNNATPHDGFLYAPGKQGLAFRFDGSSAYLSTGAASIAAPWTVCMWVNRQNAPGTGAALISDGSYELKLEQYNGTRQVGLTQFGAGDFTFGYIVPAGTWTHLAFVGRNTGTTLYVNGVLQSTITNTAPLPRGYIGAGWVTSSAKFVDFMQGNLDEILTFNRALSGSEISSIYAAGSAGLVRAPEFTSTKALGNNQVQLNLRGKTGKNLILYASPDLISWHSLGSVANPTGSTQFVDNSATNSQSFYRASE